MRDLSALITWCFKITWQTITILSPLAQCLCLPHLVRWWLTIQKVLLTKQYDLLITWFCEIMGQTQTIFSPYYDFRWGTFAHRSHDHLIMQSSKSQKLKPLYLHYQIVFAVWWLTLRGSHSQGPIYNYMDLLHHATN